jgi:hypothetical protein
VASTTADEAGSVILAMNSISQHALDALDALREDPVEGGSPPLQLVRHKHALDEGERVMLMTITQAGAGLRYITLRRMNDTSKQALMSATRWSRRTHQPHFGAKFVLKYPTFRGTLFTNFYNLSRVTSNESLRVAGSINVISDSFLSLSAPFHFSFKRACPQSRAHHF